MKYSRYNDDASRFHKHGALQPPTPDPWHDRPRRLLTLTLEQWLATAAFLLVMGALINGLAVA